MHYTIACLNIFAWTAKIPKKVRPLDYAPIDISLEEVSMRADHEASALVDCWRSMRDFRLAAQASDSAFID